MAWIELHQSLWTHRKTFLLASELGIDHVQAAGHMAHLWCWALDNAPSGSLKGLSVQAVAFGAGWKGDADTFVKAATSAGYVDETEDGLVLHDWYDYAGRLIDKRVKNAERMRNARASNVQRTCSARAGATVPNRTIPKKDISSADASERLELSVHVTARSEYTPGFEKFWSIYPRKVEKKRAFKQWITRIRQGVDESTLIQAAENYAAYCKANKTEQTYIKHPSTFLGPNSPYEEFVQAMQEISVSEETMDRPGPYIPTGLPKEVEEILRMQRGGYM